MFFESLSYQKEGYILIINLLKIPKDHVEIARLSDELSDLCTAMTLDKDARVVIINWEQGDSSSGMDLGETKPWSLATPFAKLNIPVVISINGDAIGQALELALACDIRTASETSHFGLPYINTGMIPWDGGTQRLSRLVGKSKAIELILTGEIINAHEAHRIGLVNQIVHAKDLMATVMDIAQEMASRGPIALRYAKEAINKGMDLTLEQGLCLEADLYFLLHTTKDRTEGIRAFQEKRKAQFKGT